MLAEDRHLGSVERLLHLRKAAIVGSLRPELLAIVADACRPRTLRAGEALLVEGEPVGAAEFLVEGRVEVRRAGKRVGHGEAGTALGEVGMVARAPALVSATADTDALTLELHSDVCLDLMEDHFGILRHYLREVCGRVVFEWQRSPAAGPPFVPRASRPAEAPLRDLDLVDRIFQLRRQPLFRRAGVNALAELARAVSEVHLPAGEVLWTEGEAAGYVMLVLAGEARLRSRGGFAADAGPGWSLGAAEAIAGRPRWYEAQVTRPLTALTAEIDGLFDVFEDNVDLALGFLGAISRWLLQLGAQLADAGEPRNELDGLDVSRIAAAV